MATTAVFGAAGFIGRNVVQKLLEKGLGFIAVDTVDSPFPSRVNYVKADILSPEAVGNIVKKVEAVLHLAASPLVASMENPKFNMKVNVEGTLNILDAMRESKPKKIVFSSASSVVGEVKYESVDEEHPCKPKTPYAVAKKACEDYIRVYHEVYDLNYVVFRFFNVYGPWQYPQHGALIPSLYTKLTSHEPFTVFGDGSTTRDFVYVDDVVEFCIQALTGSITNELVNLGTGKPTSILELVNVASKILDVKPNLVFKPKKAGEIDNFYANTSKLEKLFGRKPSTTLEEGLSHTFSWLKTRK